MVVANVNKSIEKEQSKSKNAQAKPKKMTLQLYKIHTTVVVKRNQWKILNSVLNTRQEKKTRVAKPMANNFKSLNMALYF